MKKWAQIFLRFFLCVSCVSCVAVYLYLCVSVLDAVSIPSNCVSVSNLIAAAAHVLHSLYLSVDVNVVC